MASRPDSRHRKPAALGRLVERVMLLDAVLAQPEFTWIGASHDNVAYFRRRMGERFSLAQLPSLTFGTPPETTTRYFPDKRPNRN